MEELSVVALSQRKESNVHLTSDLSPLRPNTDDTDRLVTYPSALVLRLRVLQIVCGISALVMGSVAFIEERRESNLGLGIPAGAATIIAAAASIHMGRNRNAVARGGLNPGTRARNLRDCLTCVRSLGPVPLVSLWFATCSFHLLLFMQSVRTLIHLKTNISSPSTEESEEDDADEDDFRKPSPRDLAVLATVQMFLTVATLTCVFVLARIEWRAA